MKNEILHNIPNYEGIGIYSIVNDNSGKTYIGSSINVRKRLLQHKASFKTLKCPVAFKEDIQNGDTFSAFILEKIDYGTNQFYIFSRESYYIQLYNSLNIGYNRAKTTASTKDELLQSLEHFKNNPAMIRYIQNIIAKRETPIFKNTNLKENKVEPYRLFKLYLPENIFSKLVNQIDSKRISDINAFIIREINETMEHDK